VNLDDLLADPPVFHRHPNGEPVSWAACDDLLRLIHDRAGPAWRTLETGAGVSTVVCAMRGTQHVSVVPDEALAQRVTDYCHAHGIATTGLRFELEKSEVALPRLASEPLDMVLIDGDHAFPVPFIDWYYTAPTLKVGGFLVVDDTQLWTGHVLREFLSREQAWALEAEFPGRAVVFKKRTELDPEAWWGAQPYTVRATEELGPRAWPAAELFSGRVVLRGRLALLTQRLARLRRLISARP
jgi:predicted O-methyltransferase YrrM